MSKFVLVSCSDESMMIDNQTFDNLADAQYTMSQEWLENGGDTDNGDYVREFNALTYGAYVRIWKIIKVEC